LILVKIEKKPIYILLNKLLDNCIGLI